MELRFNRQQDSQLLEIRSALNFALLYKPVALKHTFLDVEIKLKLEGHFLIRPQTLETKDSFSTRSQACHLLSRFQFLRMIPKLFP